MISLLLVLETEPSPAGLRPRRDVSFVTNGSRDGVLRALRPPPPPQRCTALRGSFFGGHRVVTSAKRLVLLGRARRDERSEDRDGGRARREGK